VKFSGGKIPSTYQGYSEPYCHEEQQGGAVQTVESMIDQHNAQRNDKYGVAETPPQLCR
jgi:hypothetical protein